MEPVPNTNIFFVARPNIAWCLSPDCPSYNPVRQMLSRVASLPVVAVKTYSPGSFRNLAARALLTMNDQVLSNSVKHFSRDTFGRILKSRQLVVAFTFVGYLGTLPNSAPGHVSIDATTVFGSI